MEVELDFDGKARVQVYYYAYSLEAKQLLSYFDIFNEEPSQQSDLLVPQDDFLKARAFESSVEVTKFLALNKDILLKSGLRHWGSRTHIDLNPTIEIER